MATMEQNQTTIVHDFEYDVTFSFAEEDRAFVDKVAERLKRKKIKIFYDKDALIDTWGKNMYSHLDDIYRNKARFCVMFISRHYKEKRWTQHERDSAQTRAFFSENKEYILPFRFDDTEIEGMKDTIAYLPINDFDERKLADAIITKLSNVNNRPVPQTFHPGKNIGLSPAKKAGRFLRHRIKAIMLTVFTAIGLAFMLKDYAKPDKPIMQTMIGTGDMWVRGSRCKDGWFSTSRGSGSCSHHGGVAYPDSALRDTMLRRK